MNISHKDLVSIREHMNSAAGLEDVRGRVAVEDLLPALFKIRDLPYRLDDYPQMGVVYHREWAPDSILMCGRQVAKSTNFSRSEILMALAIRNFQVVYAAPLQSQSNRYSSLYLNEAIRTCHLASELQDPNNQDRYGDAPVMKSVGHQSFLNGSGIQMTYAKTDSDRARGLTADLIDFDEIQDHRFDNVAILSQSMSNSPWNIRRFAGTAKNTDNTIQYLWNDSSQGEWVIKCPSCGHLNIPTKDHDILYMISAAGPCCGKQRKGGTCGTLLDVRSGQWWHAYPDRVDDFKGYHIPQIVVPAIVEDPAKWANLLRKIARLPPTVIMNEIFGISSDIGVRLITADDIRDVSDLGSHAHLMNCKGNYKYRVLGIDWGIAEITSFTVATVVGITPNGRVHVLYAKRYVGMNPESVLRDVMKMYEGYECHFCAPDFGVGFLNNTILNNRGLKVVQMQYVRQNKFMSPKVSHGVTTWTIDRNTALSMIFWKIKQGLVRFPLPEFSDGYTRDLLSPYESLVEQSSGLATKKFLRDPAKPDDFCHALVFACMVLYHLAGDATINMTSNTDIVDDSGMESEDIDVDMLIQFQANL